MRRLAWAPVFGCAAAALGAGIASAGLGGPDDLGTSVATWATPLAAVRLALIGAVWIWWKPLVSRVGPRRETARAYLVSRRHFYGMFLCAVELVIVQNVAGRVAGA